MNRRLAALAVCAALAVAAVPSQAAPLRACPTFKDAKGDAFMEMDRTFAPTADPTLDITSVTFKPVGKSLTVALTVNKLADRAAFGVSSRYDVFFNIGSRVIGIYYKMGPARSAESEGFYQQGITDNGTRVGGDFTAKTSGNTLTMTFTQTTLKNALGSKTIGSRITKLKATSSAQFVVAYDPWDEAVAPGSLTYVLGAACR